MVDLSDALNAPIDFEIGERVIALYPLKLNHWSLIERWIRQDILSSASRVVTEQRDTLTEPEKRMIIDVAYQAGKKVSIMRTFAQEEMFESFGCIRQILFCSIKQGLKKPDISIIDDVFINDFDAMTEAVAKVIDISLPDKKENEKDKEEVSNTTENPPT